MNKLLTTRETAEYLGMSKQFLERDRWKGASIPYVFVGTRSIRYRIEDLDTFIESRLYKPAERRVGR